MLAASNEALIDDVMRQVKRTDRRAKILPERVGRYEIREELGRGGMAVVYRAWDESLGRDVAVKVIRPDLVSPGALRPFEAEQKLLAQVECEGIVCVHDTGVDDSGRVEKRYFVMELVRGPNVLEYAGQVEPPLNTRERLQLIADICDAVQRAHQKAVIHCDLKPDNILVDESGQPKILDFGVARMLRPDPRPGRLVYATDTPGGTEVYMSPEQRCAGADDADVRWDVYSIGIIAYELLKGHSRLHVARTDFLDGMRAFRAEQRRWTVSPRRFFRGEVADILAKALEEDAKQRYQTAHAFAEDIRHYLRHEPLEARAVTHGYGYQAYKFTQRHRLPSALGIALVSLVAAFGVWTSIQRQIVEQLYRTEFALRDQTERTFRVLEETLVLQNPFWGKPLDADARRTRDSAAACVDQGRAHLPEAEARIRHALGLAYARDGLMAEARRHLTRALEIRRERLGLEHLDVASTMEHLYYHLSYFHWCVNHHRDPQEYQEAVAGLRDVLRIREKLLGSEDNETVRTMAELSHLYRMSGDLLAADQVMIEGLVRAAHASANRQVVRTGGGFVLTLISALGTDADRTQAERFSALLVASDTGSGELLSPAAVREGLDWALSFLRQQWRAGNQDAVQHLIHTLCEPFMDDPFWSYEIPGILIGFGQRQILYEDYETAEPILREAIEATQQRFGALHLFTAQCDEELAHVSRVKGDPRESEELLRECLRIRADMLGTDHPHAATTRELLGLLLTEQGMLDEAEGEFRQCLSVRREAADTEAWLVSYTEALLARCLTARGSYDEAGALLTRSYATMAADRGKTHHLTEEVISLLVSLYEAWGKPGKANEYRAMLFNPTQMGGAEKP